jgi:hypothetical protein
MCELDSIPVDGHKEPHPAGASVHRGRTVP